MGKTKIRNILKIIHSTFNISTSKSDKRNIKAVFVIIGLFSLIFLTVFLLILNFYTYFVANSLAEINIFASDTHLDQNHPLIVDYLRKHHLFPPSLKHFYNLSHPNEIHPLNQYIALALRKAFKGKPKTNRFFIECGANNGEFLSNTISLEIYRNWTGLLIEASPRLFQQLHNTQRNVWMANVCLSGNHPEQIEFLRHKETWPPWRIGNGKINPAGKYGPPRDEHGYSRSNYISEGTVSCFPLYSILSAINVTSVDFFSLDVEGHEYTILSAIPYHKVDIKVILVEHFLAPEGSLAIKTLLIKQNYRLFYHNEYDYIFIKKEQILKQQ